MKIQFFYLSLFWSNHKSLSKWLFLFLKTKKGNLFLALSIDSLFELLKMAQNFSASSSVSGISRPLVSDNKNIKHPSNMVKMPKMAKDTPICVAMPCKGYNNFSKNDLLRQN